MRKREAFLWAFEGLEFLDYTINFNNLIRFVNAISN